MYPTWKHDFYWSVLVNASFSLFQMTKAIPFEVKKVTIQLHKTVDNVTYLYISLAQRYNEYIEKNKEVSSEWQ